LNLAAFPDDLPPGVMAEIFRGGAEKVKEAGAVIAGGHTVTDREPKYGLAVTGRIDPRQILAKQGARVGDRLVLTKPLGTGVITTAHKRQVVEPTDLETAVASMTHLNRSAAAAAAAVGVHALTDVTGFGLLGHGHEVAHLSRVQLVVDFEALPWLPGARRYAEAGISPGGTERNAQYYGQWVRFEHEPPGWKNSLLHDPQTSGGLFMAAAPGQLPDLLSRLHALGETAWVIGTVEAGEPGTVTVRDG
ncbi:MAG TPA: selenide, water dikinase SelD, partial [Longilinea sp.]|nr:selenide, water dikinase SelD [Longilinea sp.]